MDLKFIYDLEGLLSQTKAKTLFELQNLGYDVEGYLLRRQRELSNEQIYVATCLSAIQQARIQSISNAMPQPIAPHPEPMGAMGTSAPNFGGYGESLNAYQMSPQEMTPNSLQINHGPAPHMPEPPNMIGMPTMPQFGPDPNPQKPPQAPYHAQDPNMHLQVQVQSPYGANLSTNIGNFNMPQPNMGFSNGPVPPTGHNLLHGNVEKEAALGTVVAAATSMSTGVATSVAAGIAGGAFADSSQNMEHLPQIMPSFSALDPELSPEDLPQEAQEEMIAAPKELQKDEAELYEERYGSQDIEPKDKSAKDKHGQSKADSEQNLEDEEATAAEEEEDDDDKDLTPYGTNPLEGYKHGDSEMENEDDFDYQDAEEEYRWNRSRFSEDDYSNYNGVDGFNYTDPSRDDYIGT